MPPRDPSDTIDLHGLKVEAAQRKLAQGLHTSRMRGSRRVTVITGRGWGNHDRVSVLGPAMLRWLKGPEGQRAGVTGCRSVNKGGALEVELGGGA
jgi:DNA-nicking Smr family endonuclease